MSSPNDPSGRVVRIDSALVARLIAAQFPQWTELPVRRVERDGWDNRTFHLGDELSVRLPSAERYAAQVAKEQRWLPRLAPRLPLPIPEPIAMGTPAHGYPWHWSIYRWIDGANASLEGINALPEFARSLARFLLALQQSDARDGPVAGPHNFYRGGPLAVYDAETRDAIAALEGEIDRERAQAVWKAALDATWRGDSVWLHGDVSAGNLLVKGGALYAVIDFGSAGVGDPACDLMMAWTFFSGVRREAFRATLALDEGTCARARARGWALWKALITLAEHRTGHPAKAASARHTIGEVLAAPTLTNRGSDEGR